MACSRHILVVDDEDLVRGAIVAILTHHGYEVTEARNGAEGIDKMRSGRPDLVLCDLRMPEVDGLGLLEVATHQLPKLPVIVMSGAGVLQDAIGSIKHGAWDYLLKPFGSADVVLHAISRALERADLLHENERYRAELERTNQELATTLKKLQEDEAAGRQIQFRLLPDNHQHFGDYEFSRDLETSAHLSGDFVDCFVISDRHLGFYLADVAGHGVPSALITVFLKSFMQQQLKKNASTDDDTILSPQKTVRALNEEMLRENLGKHLTMFYGVIDREQDRLTYVNAGQFPYPIFVEGRGARFLEGKGYPVGLFGFADYSEQSMTLPQRFCMTLCSDGVLEVMGNGPLPSRTSRLLSMVDSVNVTVEQLRDSLRVEANQPLPDDVTVLMLKRA